MGFNVQGFTRIIENQSEKIKNTWKLAAVLFGSKGLGSRVEGFRNSKDNMDTSLIFQGLGLKEELGHR